MDTGGYPGGKAAGASSWPLQSSAEVTKEWSCTSGPSWRGQGQLSFSTMNMYVDVDLYLYMR
jgi:hypothetical protein